MTRGTQNKAQTQTGHTSPQTDGSGARCLGHHGAVILTLHLRHRRAHLSRLTKPAWNPGLERLAESAGAGRRHVRMPPWSGDGSLWPDVCENLPSPSTGNGCGGRNGKRFHPPHHEDRCRPLPRHTPEEARRGVPGGGWPGACRAGWCGRRYSSPAGARQGRCIV